MDTLTYEGLYDELYKETYFDHTRENVAESVGLQIIGFKKDMRKQVLSQNYHAGTGFGRVTEGGNYNEGRGNEGDTVSGTQSHYAVNVIVTKEARTFMIQGPAGEMDISDVQDQVKGYIDDATDSIDQDIADIFNNGFVSTYTNVYGDSVQAVTPDGQALFSTAHTLPNADGTTTVFSNVINDGTNDNPAISRAAIVATIAKARKHRGANGTQRPIELDTLLVGPDDYDRAVTIVESEQVSGSDHNDTNKSIKHIKVKMWSRLASNGQGDDKSGQYYMYEAKKVRAGAIKFHSAQMISFGKSKEATDNQDWVYPLDAFYTLIRKQPQFLYGSTGVN